MVLVPFSDVTMKDCLGDYLLEGGDLQVTGCATPGAMPVVAITTFGETAPAEKPTRSEVAVMADAICEPLIHDWVASSDAGGQALQVLSYPEVWEGASTALVCAVRV